MRSARVCAYVFLALVGACSLDSPLAPDERRALDKARDRWESLHVQEYTFETRTFCFCDPAISIWTEVHVRNDVVVAATPAVALPDGYAQASLAAWRTVRELFDVIESTASSNFTREVKATFDATYGYPRTIDVRCQENVTDCGVTYEARNLRVIR